MRFLCCSHRDLLSALRIRCHRARKSPAGARGCDRAPERRMDPAAIAGGCWIRESLPLLDSRPGQHLRKALDESIKALGLSALKSPPCCPKANSVCERVIRMTRRECLDWLIPVSHGHLRSILKDWMEHYNRARPHSALGPGVPDPPPDLAAIPKAQSRHRVPANTLVLMKSVLGGLHHEYSSATAPTSA